MANCVPIPDKATIEQRLQEAELAYHQLMMGGQNGGTVVEVRDSNGEMIRYSTANASRLLQYINYLRSLLETICAGRNPYNRRPLRPVFC